MRHLFAVIAGTGLVLTACSQEAEEPAAEAVETTEDAAAPAEEPDNALREWLVGDWSYVDSCATDFAVFYRADGTMSNDSESGTWSVSGDTLTETIDEEFEMGEPGATRIDPPRVRQMDVEIVDEDRGNLLFEGESFPIRRC